MEKNYKKSLENNIFNITAVITARNFILFTAIIILFFESIGLNFFQIMIIETSFALAVFIFEVPSGFLADKFGRKKIIMLGSISSFLGMLIYSFSNQFELFVLSEILIGIGCSFISGSDSALLYDSLIELNRTKEYKKIEGRREAARTIAIGLAALLSGFFALYSFKLNFYITTILAFIAIIFSLKLTETKKVHTNEKLPELKFIKILKETITQKELILMILFSSIIFGLSTIHYFMAQKFLSNLQLATPYIGIIFAISNFAVAALALFAHKIEQKIGLIRSMLLATIFVASSFFIFGTITITFGIIGIFTYQFARGIRTPIVKDFINLRTSSSRRATILSLDGFIGRGLFVLISPLIGFLVITISFEFTSILFAILIFIGMLTITLILNKNINKKII